MTTLYVSPAGCDRWNGVNPEPRPDGSGPLATLEAARDRIRLWRKTSSAAWEDGVEVRLRGGDYELTQTFRLEAEDSGIAARPIRYAAYPGETPRLLGGRNVAKGLSPVSDPEVLARIPREVHEKVRQLDLAAWKIGSCGAWRPHGYYRRAIAPLELFHRHRPMTLARWPKRPPVPNQGYVRIRSVEDGWIAFDADEPRRWTGEGLQVDGYWRTDWASHAWPVTRFEAERNRFRIDAEFNDGVRPTPGKRIYFFGASGFMGGFFIERARGPCLGHRSERGCLS